jgi:serine/threonine protein kinase
MGPTTGRRAGCFALGVDPPEPERVARFAGKLLQQRVPLEVTVQIVRAVAEALEYAHEATDFARRPLGVVHRDVNPSNVLLSVGGVVKLVDFGISKAATRARSEGRGNLVGTVNYMCPEQVQGADAGPRGDLFSLGVVLWELIAGSHPFTGDTEFATMRAIREHERLLGRAHVPIVALTAHASASDAERCREAGMDHYLTKPLSLAALAGVLRRVFHALQARVGAEVCAAACHTAFQACRCRQTQRSPFRGSVLPHQLGALHEVAGSPQGHPVHRYLRLGGTWRDHWIRPVHGVDLR